MTNQRFSVLAGLVVVGCVGAMLASPARSQLGVAKDYVAVQATTPGTSQSGHANVSGTVRAGALRSGSLTVTGGAGNGLVLKSDANGNATWQLDSLAVPATLIGSTGSFNAIITAKNTSTDAGVNALYGEVQTTQTDARAVMGLGGGNATGVFGITFNGNGVLGQSVNNGVGVYGLATGPGLAGKFDGNVQVTGRTSIGTTATGAQLNVAANNLQGIRVIASGSSPGIGLYATSPNDAVHGETTGNGSWAGGYFTASSPSGFGAVGINFGGGVGLVGSSGTANGIGVKGENLSGGRAGFFDGRLEVTGRTSIGTSATNGLLTLLGDQSDVLHITNSGTGRGMYILSPSDTGIWTNTTTGIAGLDARGSRSDGYGVVATNNGATAWAVFGFGRSGSTGTKSFRIDHPLDPENKFLLHYSAEGPEPMNVYSGNVTTDAKGEAWVQLPDYFGDINRDLRYTLTVVEDGDTDDFVMAKVARKVQNNRFKIRTSAPNVEVSWRVEGVRNDRWMQRHGAPSEMPKSDAQRGRFQHPELYDLPPSYSLLPAVTEAKAKK